MLSVSFSNWTRALGQIVPRVRRLEIDVAGQIHVGEKS